MKTRWLAFGLVAAVLALGGLAVRSPPPAPDPPTSRFPAPFAVRGVDVSHHNGAIDWSQVAASGVQFAWVKASEGGDVVDARYRENLGAAQLAGIKAGAYHFFTFCRPGEDQASNFLSLMRASPGASMVAVDVEYVGNCRREVPPDQVRAELDRWLAIVERELSRRVIVYTTPDAAAALLVGLDRQLWVRSIPGEPSLRWSFWQFDPAGHLPGIGGPVDLNVFKGSRADLDAL